MDDGTADRELLGLLRRLAAEDRAALEAAGPPPPLAEVRRAAEVLAIDLGALPQANDAT